MDQDFICKKQELRMQNQINKIPVNALYKQLTLQHIIVQKQIYTLPNRGCDIKFVRLQQPDPSTPILPQQIKKSKYAMKVIYQSKLKEHPSSYYKQYDAVYNQIVALYMMNHPNVIRLFWHWEDEKAVYLLMEYGGAKLYAYLGKQVLSEEQIKQMFGQMCLGVREIHSRSVMHRDLCLENMVISTSNNNLIKIIDFDHAIQFTGGRQSAQGLLTSMAPEVYYQKRYNSKADIWALGIVLYELFHKRRNPFIEDGDEDEEERDRKFLMKRDKLDYTITNGDMSDDAKKLIQRMLLLNPEKRPSVAQILQSKWLTGNQSPDHKSIQENSLSSDDKKTMQIPNKDRKQISGFYLSQKDDTQDIPIKLNDLDPKNHQNPIKSDDFLFDKLINKMTMDNTLEEIEQRLRRLMRVRAEELVKKKELTLRYLAIEKNRIQKQKEMLKK